MNKTDLRVIKTKKCLYNALLILMKDNTFENIKVSDICDKALVNRSTFYSHFDDKYDLLYDFITDLKNELANELENNNEIASTRLYYLKMIELFINHIEDKKDIYSMVMKNNRNGITTDMVYQTLNQDVLKRLENETDKQANKIPREIIAKFYLGAIINVGMELLENNKYTKEEILTYFDELIPENL